VILNIEKEELGISAGLQDRVIQTYGGLVHMDFTRTEVNSS
jgi:galactokinase/mevalonate kinase-like predicted kinase